MPRPVQDPFDLSLTALVRRVGRALRLRCPHCGASGLFHRWVVMRRSCPRCHLLLDRGEPDYFLGGYLINFVVAELLIVAGGVVAIVVTWPEVPWNGIMWGLLLLMVPAPVAFYPFAKTLWLALDLSFRPLTLEDLEGHGENTRAATEEGLL